MEIFKKNGMKKSTRIMLGSLGVAHFAVAVALLPAVAFAAAYSLFFPLVILPGLSWLGILGWRLLHPNEPVRMVLRITHLVLAPFSAWLISRGFLFLDGAGRSFYAGNGFGAAFGQIVLVMGCLAFGLSIVSLCVSFFCAFKETAAAPAGAGLRAAMPPELSLSAKVYRKGGSAMHWTIPCLAFAHFAFGMVLLLLAAWWALSSFRVLPHMSHGTIWTNLPMALTMAAVHAGPLAGLGAWMMVLGHRTWRGHPDVRRALTLTHGIMLLPGILTTAVGLYAIRGATRSAARGGGLLGTLGIFPLAIGVGVVVLAAVSLVLALTVMPESKEDTGKDPTAG